VGEICSLRVSSIFQAMDTWNISLVQTRDRIRTISLPDNIKFAIDNYLGLDEERRRQPGIRSNGLDAFLFQPTCNYRTLEFNKPLTSRMVRYIVKKWSEYAGLGSVSPQDARRTLVA